MAAVFHSRHAQFRFVHEFGNTTRCLAASHRADKEGYGLRISFSLVF